MSDLETQRIKAAAFDRLIVHLQNHTEVQNIDLMITGQFCRNCLYKWYQEESEKLGMPVSIEIAQQQIYGMSYADWKAQYQTEATPAQLAALACIHSLL